MPKTIHLHFQMHFFLLVINRFYLSLQRFKITTSVLSMEFIVLDLYWRLSLFQLRVKKSLTPMPPALSIQGITPLPHFHLVFIFDM